MWDKVLFVKKNGNPGKIKIDLMKKGFRPCIIFMSVQMELMSIFLKVIGLNNRSSDKKK